MSVVCPLGRFQIFHSLSYFLTFKKWVLIVDSVVIFFEVIFSTHIFLHDVVYHSYVLLKL